MDTSLRKNFNGENMSRNWNGKKFSYKTLRNTQVIYKMHECKDNIQVN